MKLNKLRELSEELHVDLGWVLRENLLPPVRCDDESATGRLQKASFLQVGSCPADAILVDVLAATLQELRSVLLVEAEVIRKLIVELSDFVRFPSATR